MTLASADLLHALDKNGLSVFRTADMMTLSGLNASAATHALERLARRKVVIKIKRGLWADAHRKGFEAYEIVPHLTAPSPAYVSLYSALSDHGVIDEIPQVVYAVSSSRAARLQTPVGTFCLHHLPERLMWGYEMKNGCPIAEPEKAFLDLAYLSCIPRSPLDIPSPREKRWELDLRKLRAYARRFQFKPLIDRLKHMGLWQ